MAEKQKWTDEVASISFLADKSIGERDLRVDFSRHRWNRRPLPARLENQIQSIWEKRTEDNPRLWNASKFRLAKIQKSEDSITMFLGITDYQDYLGTNWNPNIQEIHNLGLKDYQNSQAYLSDPLGVSAFLLTADDKVVLIRRSRHCAEAQNVYDTPGGHPEPAEIGIVGKEVEEPCSASHPPESLSQLSGQLSEIIRGEIFASIAKEIRDEINLPLDLQSPPLFMGVSTNATSGGRPAAQFLVETRLDSAEVERRYSQQTQSEAEESTDVKFVGKSDILAVIPRIFPKTETNFSGGEEKERMKEEEKRKNDKVAVKRRPSDIINWEDLAPNAKGCLLIAHEFLSRY